MNAQKAWQEEIPVRSYDVDHTGRLRLPALFNYFQDVAGHNATALGAGYDVLQQRGLFWVLSRAKVRLLRMPAWGEQVRVVTWPKGTDGPFFLRDFLLSTGADELLVRGTTAWLLLDQEQYRPQPASALPAPIPHNVHGHALEERLGKIRPPETLQRQYERTVVLSDLDVNRHVNNARYVEWLVDAFGLSGPALDDLCTFQINYVSECTIGDLIRISKADTPGMPQTAYLEAENMTRSARAVQALFSWAPAAAGSQDALSHPR